MACGLSHQLTDIFKESAGNTVDPVRGVPQIDQQTASSRTDLFYGSGDGRCHC